MHHDWQPFANRILTQTRFNNTLMPVRKAHVPLKIWVGMQGWCHPFRRVMTRCIWHPFRIWQSLYERLRYPEYDTFGN